MKTLSRWRSWRALTENPVYLREKGGWGNPNPFYDKLSRFSPFVILGAIGFGVCAGVANPTLLSGDQGLATLWCFLCLPGILLNSLTMFGTLLAPALTAPTISMEMNRGTWEILRATPQPVRRLLLAKLFGAMARLRIWPVLFVLSLLQGLLIACGSSLSSGAVTFKGPVVGAATAARPWVEVLFAGFAGMYFSAQVRSVTTALAASYLAVIFMKIFNSSAVWIGAFSLLELNGSLFLAGSVGPTVVYLLGLTMLWFGLMKHADRLAYE